MGKDTILQLAEKHGIPVLKNIVVDKGEVPEGLEYPVITKAAISTMLVLIRQLWRRSEMEILYYLELLMVDLLFYGLQHSWQKLGQKTI